MSIQFIIGNSGSGKTEYMFRSLVREAENNPRRNYLVIVPEQFTLQTQRKLVELSSHKVIMNVDVLSFKRLAYRVFDDLGIQELQILEETGKNLVLRKVAQDLSDRLPVLGANINRMGYVGEIKSLISELTQYKISCEMLTEYVDQTGLPPMLSAKLRDVAVMYRGFEDYLSRDSLVTAEELLTVLEHHVEESELLRDAVIAFDEFTGFTPIQNHLLERIMQRADRLMFALTMDAREDFYHSRGSQELFDLPKEAIRVLMGIARKNRIEILEPVVLGDSRGRRFAEGSGLWFLEQNLFRPTGRRKRGETEEIRLASYRNPKEELVYTAREIRRLVESGSCRYREIGVVTGAVENYSGYLPEIFGKYEIPFFLDTTEELLFHPFIEFLRAAVEVVRTDFSYDAVMRFLRCGFSGIPQEQLDRLDNYLRAAGIRGAGRWSRKWVRLPRGTAQEQLDELEELRKTLYGHFRPLVQVFSEKTSTVRNQLRELHGLLVGMQMQQQLWERAEELLARNEQVRSSEYEQIYRIVMQLLEKYAAILGDECLSIQEFSELLDAGLDAAQVATIPPGYDSVTFGDIERTRLNHIKVLFFVGVNDGVIPKAEGRGGIISQYERDLLSGAGLSLAPGAREQTFIQRYYLYLNMTKPSQRLYVSYVRLDSEGKALRPSYLIGVLRRMFPDLTVEEPENWETAPDYATPETARDYLVHGSRDEEWYALARCFTESGRERSIELLLDAAYESYEPERISRVVAEALYGRELSGSVTRLERFASCAYAHFLQYGIRLRERQEAGFASVDMGNVYHEALERYSRKLQESEDDWFTVSEEHRREFCEQAMEETIEAEPNLAGCASEADSYMAERMKHIFDQTVWALTRQVRKGDFVPSLFEISFQEPDAREALCFSLGEHQRLTLTGRMDRVDACVDENGYYVKVIDYKSGGTKFDLVKIYQGTQLQLMVYMNAAMAMARKRRGNEGPAADNERQRENEGSAAGNEKRGMDEISTADDEAYANGACVLPGGVLYYHIDDPVVEAEDGMTEEEAWDAILTQLRPDGLVNREEAVYRRMDRDFTGKSQVIPVTLKKSGELSESVSHVASEEEFSVLSDYVIHRIEQAGRQILDGVIDVNPYEEGQRSSCSWCPYRAVCRLDLRIDGYAYRHPPKLSRDEVFERMREELALH